MSEKGERHARPASFDRVTLSTATNCDVATTKIGAGKALHQRPDRTGLAFHHSIIKHQLVAVPATRPPE
jgi:hypothetical protein